jgi:diguanylate cyclase (GGDEF)-like protein/PAS domain S-box-containing protein
MPLKQDVHDRIVRIVETMSLWHFVWFSIVLSEAVTSSMSVLLRGRISADYLITGGVASLLVSSVVVYLIRLVREREKEAARFSDTILDNMKDAVSVIDPKDLRILRCNEVFLREFGFQADEVVGKACYEITHQRSVPCEPPDDSCPLRATVETGEYAVAEHVHYTRDGRRKFVKVSSNPIKDGNGTVVQVVHVSADITETKQLQEELERLATTDRLTEAYNRLKYDEFVQREIERVERYGSPLSLIMFDIDHFKAVNDRYGHLTGDRVLKSVVNIARSYKRKIDYLFRWGGEEFMLAAPETDLEQAVCMADRIRNAIERHAFTGVGKVTVSFGITRFEEGDTADTLAKRADDALYKAKSNGRNRVETLTA